MSYRVLLADDSLTIHKFMSCALMEGPFELETASSVEQLEQKTSQGSYDIVLLDFELSDALDGHELAKSIHHKGNCSGIIMLFSDPAHVDEKQLVASGVREKMIKPFDGQELLEICQEMVGRGGQEMRAGETSASENLLLPNADEEQWQMKELAPPGPVAVDHGELVQEVGDWVMEVPPVIGDEPGVAAGDDEIKDVPPVIAQGGGGEITDYFKVPPQEVEDLAGTAAELDQEQEHAAEAQDLTLVADGWNKGIALNDLELDPDSLPLPEQESEQETIVGGISVKKLEEDLFKNNLSNMDPNQSREMISGEETQQLSVRGDGDSQDESKIISQSIADEVGKEQFWSTDSDGEEDCAVVKENPSSSVAQAKAGDDDCSLAEGDVESIMIKMKPVIEQSVHQYCKEIIEKVAWEIIPDLAENIIQKEIQAIRDSAVKK